MIDELDEKKSPEMKELNQKQKDVEKTSDGRCFQNIPAILPYEAKLALLKEIRHRDNRNLLKPLKEAKSNKNSKVYLEEAERNILNSDSTKTNTKKSNHRHEEKKNKGNFLYNIRYGNLPVMEFKLPDGTSGTVDKVPRR